jgi:hypothetical protein
MYMYIVHVLCVCGAALPAGRGGEGARDDGQPVIGTTVCVFGLLALLLCLPSCNCKREASARDSGLRSGNPPET